MARKLTLRLMLYSRKHDLLYGRILVRDKLENNESWRA